MTPTSATPAPAVDGDQWGPFIFSSNPSAIQPTLTPAPVVNVPNEEVIPFDHPGYREFDSPDDLARFLDGRAVVLEPASVPDGAVLLGAWAVELDDGRITDTGISYRFAESNQTIKDPDIWIASTYRIPRPVVIDTLETERPNGQIRGVPQKVTVHGLEAVYLPYTNPADIDVSLQFSSALSWFDEAGVFWSVQGRNLDLTELMEIANSLESLTVS